MAVFQEHMNSRSHALRKTGLLLTAASLFLGGGAAFAQETTAADGGGLQEIIVTAQRRSEKAQDVPISVAAISGDALRQSGVQTTADLSKMVVGLQIGQTFAVSNPTIFIRGLGVNDYNPASSGAVGVMIDDVFLNSGVGQLFNVYDVEGVEVLRGPQGTLFGRNTTAGLINYTTRRPTFTPSADLALTYGRFNEVNVEGGIGGPIIADTVAARASIKYRKRDGYVKNLVDGRYQNGVESIAGRLQLLITPNDRLNINLKVEGGHVDGTAFRGKAGGIVNVTTGQPCTGDQILSITQCKNPFTGYVDTANIDEAKTNVLNNYERLQNFTTRMAVNWSGDGISVTSVSAFVRNRRQSNQDQDSSPIAMIEGRAWDQNARQISQEIRVNSDNSSPFQWILGGFFLDERLEELLQFDIAGFVAQNGGPSFDPVSGVLGVQKQFVQNTRSLAAFVQASYALTDQLKVTAGFRYTADRKKLSFLSYGGPVGVPYGKNVPALVGLIDASPNDFVVDGPAQRNDTFNKPTWRLAVDYKVSPNILLYSSYSRGYRSGGRNTGATSNIVEFTFVRPEKVDAFELGIKSDLLNRRLRINAAGYYYNSKDLQVFSLEPGTPAPFQRLNNADARIYGGEIEVVALPVRGLQVSGGVSLLHTEYTRLIDPIRGNENGNRLSKAPTLQLTGAVSYEWALAPNWDARAALDGSYQSKIYHNPANVAPQVTSGYGLVNGRLSVSNHSGLEVAGWVKNITNKRYLQDIIDLSSVGVFTMFYNEPRTYGVTLSYKM